MTEIRSQRKKICFGPGLPVLRIGERINPSGKPKIQKKIETGDLAWIKDLAAKQETAGASVISVNSLQMSETLMASDVLLNHDPFAMNYLELYRRNQT